MAIMDKPIVVKKMHSYMRKYKKNNNRVGDIPRTIILNYNNICNFKCPFCYSTDKNNKNVKVSLDFLIIEDLMNQADELGIWEVVIQGGELLVDLEKLEKLLNAIRTDRFHIVLITNGYLLTKKVADILAENGVDSVQVSISGMNEEEHNRSRGGIKDAHKRALEALDNVDKAGMNALVNVIFGHYNAHSEDLYQLLDYAKSKKYGIYLMMAMPFGDFREDRMDAEDFHALNEIRKNYDCVYDPWDCYDRKKERISGCWTMNRIYISPLGDVMPCPFIHIKVGNVKEQSLKEILDYGFSIRYFGEYSPICLSAHNKTFREKFIPNEISIFEPLDAKEIFSEDDYIVKKEEIYNKKGD